MDLFSLYEFYDEIELFQKDLYIKQSLFGCLRKRLFPRLVLFSEIVVYEEKLEQPWKYPSPLTSEEPLFHKQIFLKTFYFIIGMIQGKQIQLALAPTSC